MLQAGRLWVRVPMRLLNFLSDHLILPATPRPLAEMSAEDLSGVKRGRRVRLKT
jgi:hypothetical protein